MTAQTQAETRNSAIHHPQGSQRTLRFAWWISQIGSPPVLGLAGIVLLGFTLGWREVWPLLLMYASLTLLIPLAFILLLLHTGRVSDYNLTKREERFQPMLLSLATAVVGWLLLNQTQAHPLLMALATANLAQTITYFLITLRWKVSIHSAVAAGLTVLAGAVAGTTVWALVFLLLLIAWSRVVLQRHTIGQTVVGASIGSLFLALALAIYGV